MRYISFLCDESAPVLGPSLRSLQKLLTLVPRSFGVAAQLRLFSLFDRIIQKLIPHDFTRDDAYPTRAKERGI